MSAPVLYMSMSLDGFIAGSNDGPGNGLGDDGPQQQHPDEAQRRQQEQQPDAAALRKLVGPETRQSVGRSGSSRPPPRR